MSIDAVNVRDCARAVSYVLTQTGGVFGSSIIPTEEQLLEAYACALPEIAKYCWQYRIKVTELDTVKLITFAIPHLRRILPAINLERYIHSCMLIIEAKKTGDLEAQTKSTVKVCERLSINYPPQDLAVYAYLKGYQEGLTSQSNT